MLRLVIVVFFVVVAVLAAADLDTEWKVFKAKFNKEYSLPEDVRRKSIWMDNKKYIEEHNTLFRQGVHSYFLGENEYADMTNKEFVGLMNRAKMPTHLADAALERTSTRDLPDSVDWRTKGYVTPVKSQGQCGSCWAFSAVGSMEGQHFKATGDLVSLSESNLVDCTASYGNGGCKGGWPYLAYEYVIANGIDTESSYPYRPATDPCNFNNNTVGATIKSFRNLPIGDESYLQKSVAEVGPVSVCIDAKHQSFQLYSGGIYYESACSSYNLDHCVLAVGYGTDAGEKFWLVKNSWGTNWGMDGYIKMIRDYNNNCGIATAASYPLV